MKPESRAAAERISDLAREKKAEKIVILDVEGICSYADALIICQGRSSRQVQTIASHILQMMKKEDHPALGSEGESLGHWVLVDFIDIVVHVFYEPVREYYDLEGIWPDAKKVSVES